MLTRTEDKKSYFNHYWQTRDLPSADARSRQRAAYVQALMGDGRSSAILDVGCGRGTVMSFLAAQGYNIGGCDLASDSITALQNDGYDVFLFDIEQDDLPKKYDVILCLEVLQQVFDPVAALTKLTRFLTDDGYLIVSVPNEFHLWSRLQLLRGKSHLGHFEESHIRLFNPRRARQMFERAGLSIDRSISVSVMPPSHGALNRIGEIMAGISPSLFSLSQIYRLRPR
jgi:2-polyprenyl-3-methyl-5-hydroxy-6-metoxy-1,4-benzoquinol methylase